MKVHSFHATQRLAVSLERAWEFFSNPGNLREITPPWLGFEVTSALPGKVYPGLILTYRVTPLAGLPLTWVTEITHVAEPRYFVDEQRFGPYRMWHHEHRFEPVEGGVEVSDLVHYALRPVPFGGLLNRRLVRPRLEAIFEHRRRVLAVKFGELP